ncbi:MAG: transcription termination factor Rho [Candidatus Latescibacterota bacterium]|nr:MAG: transcription termination factor Rho [Candidatus Latescibacterota bacterium]
MDYHELEKMTVIKLREETKKFPDVKGVSGMKKEELIALLVEKLDIKVPEKKKKKAPSVPKNKMTLKKKIMELRGQKEAARAEKDSRKKVTVLRKRIHSLKRQLRKIA